MCGIAGIVSTDRLAPDDHERAVAMRDVMSYRGPDGEGLYTDDRAALAHRRLSIVDLAGGHQPLSNETGDVWVTFNGEIYNHADVRAAARGGRSHVPHALRYGDDRPRLRAMGRRLRAPVPRHVRVRASGMLRKRRLLLVRDRLGVKPLYWALARRSAAVRLRDQSHSRQRPRRGATESRRVSGSARDPRHRRHRDDVRGDLQAAARPSADLRGRTRAEPSGTGTCRSTVRIRSWIGPATPRSIDQFRTLLRQSVRLRLMSDVPLGMFLSGGIDSSAIAALMAREIDRPVRDVLGGVRGSPVQRAGVRARRSRGPSAPNATRSSSTTTTSSARCRVWSGTKTSRSRTRRACRCISSRCSRASTSRSC